MTEGQLPANKTSVFKRVAPWAGAAVILLLLFQRVDTIQFVKAIRMSNMFIYLPLMIIFIPVWFCIDSHNYTKLLLHFKYRISNKEMMRIRGVTYLLMILNYGLGLGGIAYYLKQYRNIPLLRSSSLIIFFTFIENISITFLALMGCLFTSESSIMLSRITLVCFCILFGYIAVIVIFKSLPTGGFFKKIKNNELFKPYDEAKYLSYLLLVLWRGLYLTSFIPFFYIAVKAFNMNIPFFTLAALVPVIFIIGNLPITPMGLGTIQAAMLFFFKDYGSEANILAFSITYSTSLLLFRIPIGLYYLRKMGKPIDNKTSPAANSES